MGETTAFRAVENGDSVAMLDMNGDGLPDRVMIQPGQPYTYYLVQFNTGSGFTTTNQFGPYTSQGQSNDIQGWAGLTGQSGLTGNMISIRMLDVDGNSLPDRVMLIHSSTGGPLGIQYQTNLSTPAWRQ